MQDNNLNSEILDESNDIKNSDLNDLLIKTFKGRVVRKDLTKSLKEGANVPVYVLEYLLGMYCASDDDEVVEMGLQSVKKILTENYVRPDEAEKVKSTIRERGTFKVIDKVGVRLNQKKDIYEARLSNLGIQDALVPTGIVKDNDKLLTGGIWCIVTLQYFYEEGQKTSPFSVVTLKPIQMPNMDVEEVFTARRSYSTDQWLDVLLRSVGMEPTNLEQRVKWHLLSRMIPFVENNYNVCELGPRGTGKSHVYKECSPNSLLVSGGQTTVANLFYNMSSRQVGLVGMWDVVAFDEVAGINFKDRDGVQIMKDYMASGSFARGRDSIEAKASMVFIGNINHNVETLIKTSHLLSPFPDAMIDTAFFDRFHAYIPGWEIPKMRPEFFTNQYGLITDYLAEFMREMRKRSFADAIDKFFKVGNNLNQRDVIAVRRTVSGLLKLLHPGAQYNKEDVRECLVYALEVRRRIKEQLKKLGGMEFFDVNFSYIDNESLEEIFVSVPEQGGNKLIPEGVPKPGVIHLVSQGSSGQIGLYRYETQMMSGSGKHSVSGFGSNTSAKEAIRVGFDYFKGNLSRISTSAKFSEYEFHLQVVELNNTGPNTKSSLAALIAFCSVLMNRSTQEQMVVLGDITLGGIINPVDDLAGSLQLAMDNGARRVLLPMSSATDIPSVPAELFSKFQISFYADPVDAVYKALGAG
ncbi:protease Lon-related BREX system protein BrxL [Marinomonas algarum]|uniref:Protease Lon-related BREX system protein BrxL n=1 Tax=Marinomonas algarum TaxID=2883105 RepID=A0A9X1IJA3_9GAMM|nr:protease Lon-related BREX system protein BrxL [Marinomonas algarum]MCB5160342.1 protease Lon-related BREX system protein BrxL [Marinomonas algarum]